MLSLSGSGAVRNDRDGAAQPCPRQTLSSALKRSSSLRGLSRRGVRGFREASPDRELIVRRIMVVGAVVEKNAGPPSRDGDTMCWRRECCSVRRRTCSMIFSCPAAIVPATNSVGASFLAHSERREFGERSSLLRISRNVRAIREPQDPATGICPGVAFFSRRGSLGFVGFPAENLPGRTIGCANWGSLHASRTSRLM